MGERKVNSFRSKLFLCCLLVIAGAAAASAQDWPMPAATPNTNVPCAGCLGTRDGKLTPGYPTVLNFLGRYVDSEAVTDYQGQFRTVRARGGTFSPERNRLYMLLGSGLAAYNIDSFFSKLSSHASLSPSNYIQTVPYPNTHDHGYELFLFWDRYFYAENGGQWVTPLSDGQDRLFWSGVDFDDRKICYLAYNLYGWGMVLDDPTISDAGLMQNITLPTSPPAIAQFLPGPTDLRPFSLINLKTSTGSYYVLYSDSSDASRTQEWNVTDYLHPAQMADQNGRSIFKWAKSSTGSRVGVVELNYTAKIYSADAMAQGQSPIQNVVLPNGQYSAVDSDGTNFYFAGVANSTGVITVMSPNANGGYDRHDYPILDDAGTPVWYAPLQGIRAGYGLLTVFGAEQAPLYSPNVRLFKLANGVPTQISLDNAVVGGNHGPFFAQYYVHPDRQEFKDAFPYKYKGKTYIVVEANGLGDVWEVRAGDSLNGSLKSAFETPNPNSLAPASSSPFYGDRQTFTSSLVSGAPATVNWTFDDGTSGSTLPGAPDIKHQFGGITSAASLPAVQHATATNAADNSMTATVAVTLHKPDVRFALSGTSYLFKLPDASSTAPIVTSDTFNDGSDGSVEGHYTEWVLDGASTKKIPSDTFSVGACGAHTLNFLGHYGAYFAGTTIQSLGSDLPLAINGFVYASKPFVVTVKPPPPIVAGGSLGNFTAITRATSTAADLPAGLSTPVTYLWEVISASGASSLSARGPATLGSIPPYSPSDPMIFNNTHDSKVRLTVSAAASAVGATCVPFIISTATTDPLNAPDPTIVKSGCDNAGSPCSFSVTSSGSQTGWAYAWTMTNSTATSSTSTFAPAITTGGTYTITLAVTNAINTATRTITINPAQPRCTNNPSAANTTISTFGCGCAAGETVSFHLSAYLWQPDPVCDKAPPPPPPPPPPPGTCAAQTATSATVGYLGAQSSCTFGYSCNAGEVIGFAEYASSSYNFDCSTSTFLWNFGDNTPTTTDRFPQHTYTSVGTYQVSVSITNTGGTGVYTTTVQIGSGGTVHPPCGTLNAGTISFGWSGSGCTQASGVCDSSSAVAFSALGIGGYDLSCGAHTYDWDYGDNSTHGSGATPSPHTYSGAGTYVVNLKAGYGTSTYTVTNTVHVKDGTGATGNCPTMVADGNVQILYFDTSGQCSILGGNCPVGESVQFQANSYQYDFACSSHTFKWDFGDGNTTTEKNPAHAFAQNGTYKVKLTITNSHQSIDLFKTVVVGTGVSGPPRGGRAVRH